MKIIRELAKVDYSMIGLVGGKAASLGEMIKAGINVPPGFVIITEAYKHVMTPKLEKTIRTAFKQLGAERVAVRSSAVAEDSESTSWAGQLETYLNVTESGLVKAVKDCWASMESEHAKEYAAHNKVAESERAVAVIIQKMVDSDVSGVMFTANPINDHRDEIVIESIYGLGELIVQGMVTPDNWIINKRSGATISSSPRRQTEMLVYHNSKNRLARLTDTKLKGFTLGPQNLKDLANVAVRLEKHYKKPQDVEWAIAKGELFIVQARPITTLSKSQTEKLPAQPKAPKGVKYALTVPQSVLFAELTFQGCLRPMMREALGINFEVQYIAIDAGGAIYFNYDTDQAFDNAFIANRPIEDALHSFVDAMAATARKLDRRSSLASAHTRRTGNREDILEDLEDYWQAYKLHMTTLCNFWNVENLLAKAITEEMRSTGHDMATQGLDQFIKSKETNQYVRERRCFEKLVRRFAVAQKQIASQNATPELMAALQHHVREFSFQLTPFNLGKAPTAVELLPRVNEVKQNLGEQHNDQTEQVSDLGINMTPKLRRLIHILEQMTFWKNERVDVMSMADARMELLYQAAAESLGIPIDELFCMTSVEIKASLKAGKPVVSHDVLAERAVAYCIILHNGKIDFYEPSQPDDADVAEGQENVLLQGIASSPGLASGKVRLLLSIDQSADLQTGEVLVTTMTRPEMGAALDRAAAFVTNEGGLLCHAAIISREMKKPCVIATIKATKVLKTGDFVEVDGTKGTVKIIA